MTRIKKVKYAKETSMNKRKIIALLLCASLVFSGGCSLIDIDQEKADAIDKAKVLAEYKDTDITKGQVVQYMTQSLSQQGMTIESVESDETYWEPYKENIIKELVINQIALEKAAELGLDKLTEDEIAKVDEDYNSTIDSIKSYAEFAAQSAVDADDTLNYDEEFQKAMNDYYDAIGYTAEELRAQMEKDTVFKKAYDYFIKDIAVTDEEVKDNYDSNVSIQQGNLENDPSFFEMQSSFGARILVYPEGYMNVRHIFLAFDDETKSAAAAAYGEGDTAKYDELIGQAKAAIQTKIDDIQTRIAAGEDFTALMDEYNEDTAYSYEPAKTEGTVTGPYKQVEIPGYLDAVAKLTTDGQISDPVVNYNGVYFIQSVKQLGGVVPFEDVKEDLKAEMLANKQQNEWATVTQGWIDSAKDAGTLKMYPERY
jgi:hypothetical protein